MSVHHASPGDIYVDAQGKLWRCMAICSEPTVTFEEVEGHTATPPDPTASGYAAAQQFRPPSAPPIIKERKCGGVGGLIWNGWKRIWQKEDSNK